MPERNANRYPLANDLDGNPLELPPEAVAWRVRRRSGKQGRPQCVYDCETGAQLELDLDATLEDLRDYGPGVYRLDAIDKDGKAIPNVIAQTELRFAPPAEEPSEPEGAFGSATEAGALIRRLVEANVTAMQAMASAFGPITPVHPHPFFVADRDDDRDTRKKGSIDLDQMNALVPVVMQALDKIGNIVATLKGQGAEQVPAASGTA